MFENLQTLNDLLLINTLRFQHTKSSISVIVFEFLRHFSKFWVILPNFFIDFNTVDILL
jgi:hypothetical protein